MAQGEDEELYVIQEQGGTYVLNFAQSDEDESMTLYQFVQACEQVTGLNFTWGAETESLLKNQQVNLLGAKTIKKERFYSFFQVMMIISDFVCTEIGEDDISVIKIDSLATAAEQPARGSALRGARAAREYEDQPATLITTVVSLPNTDVRQVSNSMRSMITDPNTQQMLPAGNSQSMVLVGFGSNVVALANMLKIIDDASQTDEIPPEFDVIKLEYASAEDIAATVEELLEAANQNRSSGPQAQGPQGALNRNQGRGQDPHREPDELPARHGHAGRDAAHQGARGAPRRGRGGARAELPHLRARERQRRGPRRDPRRVPSGRRPAGAGRGRRATSAEAPPGRRTTPGSTWWWRTPRPTRC